MWTQLYIDLILPKIKCHLWTQNWEFNFKNFRLKLGTVWANGSFKLLQCDEIGRIFEIIGNIFYLKRSPIDWWLFGQLWKPLFFKSIWWTCFLGTFWNNSGLFYFNIWSHCYIEIEFGYQIETWRTKFWSPVCIIFCWSLSPTHLISGPKSDKNVAKIYLFQNVLKNKVALVECVTRWLDYSLNIWPFTRIKICPTS